VTFQDRVDALQDIGLTNRQTRFLVTVALHGGYCLRRQYVKFAGIAYGARVREFLDALVVRRLARRLEFRRDRGYVYHVHRATIYEAIGQRDNRNRRHVSAAAIARKLMLLDHVLTEPFGHWYATEEEKVELFTRRFLIAPERLPQRTFDATDGPSRTTRDFIHKLPIYVAPECSQPQFVFLVTDTTGDGLLGFLRDHLPLLDQLSEWRVVAIVPPNIAGLRAAETAFQRFCRNLRQPETGSELTRLKGYFLKRDALERNELTPFEGSFTEAAAQWREAQPIFRSADVERLYARWRVEGDGAFLGAGAERFLAAVDAGHGVLETRVLAHCYDRFGTLAGVS
jgi:hypothetical protein